MAKFTKQVAISLPANQGFDKKLQTQSHCTDWEQKK